ncbi:MAG: type IV secretion system DNA-binding domain-containing protein [Reyranella sp.]|nr:type IV secretion system DNA-binding domain-containing protein [Reyranella sp.]MBL6851920.1 type IV secretion system DNA-binding domain-containing protein [Alphaproteobacteria bacterium]
MNPEVNYFGRVDFRADHRQFGIKQADRLFHMYAIGKTGTGKSTLLECLIRQDIECGRGLALIDPHGDLVDRVASSVPAEHKDRVRYLNAADPEQPFGYNPLKRVSKNAIPLAASGLLEAFKKHWADSWGVRMEHVFRNAIYALLEIGDATLPGVLLLLSDKKYRAQVVSRIENEVVKAFWENEFDQYSQRYRADAIAPIQNKIGALLADPMMKRILTEPDRMLHFRRLMDRQEILLVNLARGKIGEDSAVLLGSLIVTTIGLAAFGRADVPEAQRVPFFLYMDEFQNFTTLSIATMISELRKYRVGLILANQHLSQVQDDIRDAILGNVGTLVAFRLGPYDASTIAREFVQRFDPQDLMRLANHHIYVRLMIDGEPARPFSALTLLPGVAQAAAS